MNYEVIKYVSISIIVIVNIILILKIKERKTIKIIIGLISCISIACLFGSTYQYYATDNVNKERFLIKDYKYNNDETKVTIKYLRDNDKQVSIEVNSDKIHLSMCNGIGEIEKRNREYKKELVLFNKFIVPLGSIYEKDDDFIVLNETNFMSEEEAKEYYKYIDSLNPEVK